MGLSWLCNLGAYQELSLHIYKMREAVGPDDLKGPFWFRKKEGGGGSERKYRRNHMGHGCINVKAGEYVVGAHCVLT